MLKFGFFLKRPAGDFHVEVAGDYYPASEGYRNSMGVPEEPDDPECFEIESITDAHGNDVETTEEEDEAITAAGLELVKDDCVSWSPDI